VDEIETKLPSALSALLRLAVADAKKCEADPRYSLHMSAWHISPSYYGDKCWVCMAGAVMAQTLKIPLTVNRSPLDFDDDTEAKLGAINDMRCGFLISACQAVGVHLPKELLKELGQTVVDRFMHDLRRAPWETYEAVADELERAEY